MTISEEMLACWARTESYLNEAISLLPKEIIQEADEAKNFIKHNELGMAFDVLQDIAQEHNLSDQAFEKNMMSAAKEMDLVYKK